MSIQRIILSALVIGALAGVGCNSDRLPTYPTTGTIQFQDGRPVRFGSIEFYNVENDITARGTIGRDGTYQVGTFQPKDGTIAGEHQVVIIQVLMPAPVIKSEDGAHHHHDHGRHVDKKYATYATSPLKCTIEKGNNLRDFIVSQSRN